MSYPWKAQRKQSYTVANLPQSSQKNKPWLDSFHLCTHSEIAKKQQCLRLNLSLMEQRAMLSLTNNSDIIIQEADKRGATAVLDKTVYIQEGKRQFSNSDFYKILTKDPIALYQ